MSAIFSCLLGPCVFGRRQIGENRPYSLDDCEGGEAAEGRSVPVPVANCSASQQDDFSSLCALQQALCFISQESTVEGRAARLVTILCGHFGANTTVRIYCVPDVLCKAAPGPLVLLASDEPTGCHAARTDPIVQQTLHEAVHSQLPVVASAGGNKLIAAVPVLDGNPPSCLICIEHGTDPAHVAPKAAAPPPTPAERFLRSPAALQQLSLSATVILTAGSTNTSPYLSSLAASLRRLAEGMTLQAVVSEVYGMVLEHVRRHFRLDAGIQAALVPGRRSSVAFMLQLDAAVLPSGAGSGVGPVGRGPAAAVSEVMGSPRAGAGEGPSNSSIRAATANTATRDRQVSGAARSMVRRAASELALIRSAAATCTSPQQQQQQLQLPGQQRTPAAGQEGSDAPDRSMTKVDSLVYAAAAAATRSFVVGSTGPPSVTASRVFGGSGCGSFLPAAAPGLRAKAFRMSDTLLRQMLLRQAEPAGISTAAAGPDNGLLSSDGCGTSFTITTTATTTAAGSGSGQPRGAASGVLRGSLVVDCGRHVQSLRHPWRDVVMLMTAAAAAAPSPVGRGRGWDSAGAAAGSAGAGGGPAGAAAVCDSAGLGAQRAGLCESPALSGCGARSLVLVGVTEEGGRALGLYVTFPVCLPDSMLHAVRESCSSLLETVLAPELRRKLRDHLSSEIETLAAGVPGSYVVVPGGSGRVAQPSVVPQDDTPPRPGPVGSTPLAAPAASRVPGPSLPSLGVSNHLFRLPQERCNAGTPVLLRSPDRAGLLGGSSNWQPGSLATGTNSLIPTRSLEISCQPSRNGISNKSRSEEIDTDLVALIPGGGSAAAGGAMDGISSTVWPQQQGETGPHGSLLGAGAIGVGTITGVDLSTDAALLTLLEAESETTLRGQLGVLVESIVSTLRCSMLATAVDELPPQDCRQGTLFCSLNDDLEELMLTRLLGTGAAGVVMLGRLGTVPVAVKLMELPDEGCPTGDSGGVAATASNVEAVGSSYGRAAVAADAVVTSGGGGGGGDVSGWAQKAADGATAAAPGAKANVGGGGGGGGARGTSLAGPHAAARQALLRNAMELAVLRTVSHVNIVQVFAIYSNVELQRLRGGDNQGAFKLLRSRPEAESEEHDPCPPCVAVCMELADCGSLETVLVGRTFPQWLLPQAPQQPQPLQPQPQSQSLQPQRRETMPPRTMVDPPSIDMKGVYLTLLELGLALRHLHARRLVHRDIKPANVLLKASPSDPRGWVCKLADFGFALVLDHQELPAEAGATSPLFYTIQETASGTVTHMAPEAFRAGARIDASVDIFALGIVMWELCAGQGYRPYRHVAQEDIAEAVLAGMRPVFPEGLVPLAYRRIAEACWAHDPRRRPSAAGFVAFVKDQLEQLRLRGSRKTRLGFTTTS